MKKTLLLFWPCDTNADTIASSVTFCSVPPCSSVGSNEKTPSQHLELSVFPNPMVGSGRITINGLNGQSFVACIYDLSGQLVDYQRNVSRNHIEINASSFQSGMYWCTVKTNIGQTQVKFIVH